MARRPSDAETRKRLMAVARDLAYALNAVHEAMIYPDLNERDPSHEIAKAIQGGRDAYAKLQQLAGAR